MPDFSPSKRCTKCKVEKPLTEFYTKRGKGRVERPVYYSHCKACAKAKVKAYTEHPDNRARVLQYKRDHWKKVKGSGQWREWAYKRNYGTTKTAYDIQLASQNGRCAVCNRLPAEGENRFAFDHDHETGLTRAVLCPSCNGGLGCFRDDPALLRAAISYLADWQQRHVKDSKHGL